MAERHYIYTIQHDTWRQQVVVTGMEVASVSSTIERLDIQNMTGDCQFLADQMNRSICRCTPFNIWKELDFIDAKVYFLRTENFTVFASLPSFSFHICSLKKEAGKYVSIQNLNLPSPLAPLFTVSLSFLLRLELRQDFTEIIANLVGI